MSLLVDIATLLTTINSNIYYGDRPDTPDNIITLYYTGGQPSVHNIGVKAPILEKPTFQVEVRNASSATATTQAESVKNALNGLTKSTINGTL